MKPYLSHIAVLAAAGAAAGGAGYFLAPKDTPPAAVSGEPAENGASPDNLKMTAAQVAANRIELVRPQMIRLSPQIAAPGSVSSMPGGEAVLTARADGAIVKVLKGIGDPVAVGETLALIESRDASAISADVEVAKAKADLSRAEYLREERLYKAGATSLQSFEVARTDQTAAEAELRRAVAAAQAAGVSQDGRTLRVSSPTKGRISDASASLGAFVTAGAPLYRIVDPSRIEIRVSVPAQDADKVEIGSAVGVQVLSGETLTATVRSVTPNADAANRSATVVLAPDVGATGLRPGEAVRATLTLGGASDTAVLTLPAAALQMLDGKDVVFLKTSDGFRVRPVTIGQRTGDQVAILSGLGGENEVAGRNAFLLKAELSKGDDEEGK